MLNGVSDRALLATVREVIDSVPGGTLADRLRMIASVDHQAACGHLRVPLTHLVATGDRLIGSRGRRQVIAARSGAVTREVVGPHLLLQACPTAAAAVIRDAVDP